VFSASCVEDPEAIRDNKASTASRCWFHIAPDHFFKSSRSSIGKPTLWEATTESAASAGELPQVVVEKAEKRNRRENSLSAVFVNWFGAIIPLRYQKLPRQNVVRNSLEERQNSVSAMR
jgi:hypothetical protein